MTEPHEDEELLEAIRLASEHLGVPHDPETPALDAGRGAWPGLVVSAPLLVALVLTLALGVASMAFLGRSTNGLDAGRMEADLRWSVAQVVTEVERLRSVMGRLPAPAEIHPLLSEAVEYRPEGSSYVVTGRREDVEVEFDGRLTLERWRTLELYGDGR